MSERRKLERIRLVLETRSLIALMSAQGYSEKVIRNVLRINGVLHA